MEPQASPYPKSEEEGTWKVYKPFSPAQELSSNLTFYHTHQNRTNSTNIEDNLYNKYLLNKCKVQQV